MKRTSTLLLAVVVGVGRDAHRVRRQRRLGGRRRRRARRSKIGVILPDTKSSVRWESKDRPALEAAFKDAGVRVHHSER